MRSKVALSGLFFLEVQLFRSNFDGHGQTNVLSGDYISVTNKIREGKRHREKEREREEERRSMAKSRLGR